MGLISIDLNPESGALSLSANGMPELSIKPEQVAGQTTVTIWNDQLIADVAEAPINDWFSQFLGTECRLVRYGDTSQRRIDPAYAQSEESVAFADGFPLLVTHVTTLDLLNQQLIEQDHDAVTMQRFRPNIVLKGDLLAQDEYQWKSLKNEALMIDLVKPCSRCLVTNLDPKTATKTGNTVLATLAKKHRLNDKAIFGINGISHQTATLALGDHLEVAYQESTKT